MTDTETIAVSVIDSVTSKTKHTITISITNNTEHGVYIESIPLLEPVTCQVTTREDPHGGISLGGSVKASGNPALPYLLGLAATATFEVIIPKIDEAFIQKQRFEKLQCQISVLGDIKLSGPKSFSFMIRN